MTLNARAASRGAFVRMALGAAVGGPLAAPAGCSVLNGSSGSNSSGGQSSSGLEKSKITVGILTGSGSAPAKLAERNGYFTQQGLDVTVKSYVAYPQGLAALQNGEIDLTTINYL